MNKISFRFYAELNDFLPLNRRQVSFDFEFSGRVSIKHLIESLGVPHIEVDLILVNSRSVDFHYIVQPGDRISVFPVFETIDISSIGRLRPNPLRESKFVLDIHLGQLATYLRLIGFDTLYRNDFQDANLAQISLQEKRILLTKDRGLLKRNSVTHGYYIRESDPELQLLEVVRRFDLRSSITPFSRCLRCNGLIVPVSKQAVRHRLEDDTRKHFDDFTTCSECGQIYWKGSHYERMHRFLKRMLGLEDLEASI